MLSVTSSPDRAGRTSVAILRQLFGPDYLDRFSVRLWNGAVERGMEPPVFTLVLNAPHALRAAFMPPLDLNPARAYIDGIIDIEGDAEEAIDAFERALARLPPWRVPLLLARLLELPKPPAATTTTASEREAHLSGRVHSLERDRAAIRFHYDQPVEFYRTFLDREMVYSCAYFPERDTSLDDAQLAKIDHTLRKLRVAPGERLLDIGCGWGALVMRAAERYGARALGITLSRAQHEEANRRIAERGLGHLARVELCDYRELRDRAPFDKIVSIGMVEHVGRPKLDAYFRTAWNALRPGGLFLNHGIAEQSRGRRGGRASGFIDRYVFPDGELVAVSDGLLFAERVGFEIRDVENLREHYHRTLRAWVANLERNRSAAIAAAGEKTYRIWRLYMAGSAQGFRRGRLGVFQSLLLKPNAAGGSALPPTRRDLYADPAPAAPLAADVVADGIERTATGGGIS